MMRQNKAFLLLCPPDVLDADQRPILEGRSVQYPIHQDSIRACPYTDSRRSSPNGMNIDSLKSFSVYKADVASYMYAMGGILKSSIYLERSYYDLSQLHALSYLCYKSPMLNFSKKILGLECQVPVAQAIASRICHGLVNMLDLMMLQSEGSLAGLHMTPQELYEYSDKNGHLIGLKEVCSASPSTIIKFLDLCQDSLNQPPVHTQAYSCLFPIHQLGCIILELEFASLIYETVRCKLWNHTNKGFTQLFATPHCRIAKRIASSESPFDQLLFHRALSQWRNLESNSSAAEYLYTTAAQCLLDLKNNSVSLDEIHSQLYGAYLQVLALHAEKLDELLPGGSFLSLSIDTFFGQWPT